VESVLVVLNIRYKGKMFLVVGQWGMYY